MSLFDFRKAVELKRKDVPFYALIMAAMMRADNINSQLLKAAWPELWAETERRYNAPGGVIEEDNIPEWHKQITL